MAHLAVVASPFAILPPPPSRFCLLALYCTLSWHLTANLPPSLHPTANHRLASYCPVAPLPSVSSPIVALLLVYARLWDCTASVAAANALVERCNYRPVRCIWLQCSPTFQWFSSNARSLSSVSGPRLEALAKLSFVLGSVRKGLGLSTCAFL